MNEAHILKIAWLLSLAELDQRQEAILKSLAERNLLSDALKIAITTSETLTALEDIYQPHRPKRRTRATIARERGLEPLADILFSQQSTAEPIAEAKAYVSAEKGVADVASALAGARDILAERIWRSWRLPNSTGESSPRCGRGQALRLLQRLPHPRRHPARDP